MNREPGFYWIREVYENETENSEPEIAKFSVYKVQSTGEIKTQWERVGADSDYYPMARDPVVLSERLTPPGVKSGACCEAEREACRKDVTEVGYIRHPDDRARLERK
jgi:hypothetical protein